MKKLVIVGGGVIGLFTAYYAAQEGFDVTVLDAAAASFEGCSVGNAGMIVPSHFVPLASPGMVAMGLRMLLNPESPFSFAMVPDAKLIRWAYLFNKYSTPKNVEQAAPVLADMNLESKKAFEALEADLGEFELVEKGLLMLCKTEKALDHESHMIADAEAHGIRAARLNRDELAAADPGIEMDAIGAVHFQDDAHLSPAVLLPLLRQKLVEMGVKTVYESPVTGFRTAFGSVSEVVTAAGEYDADEVVVAAGAWSGEVLKMLGVDVPVVAGKGYSMTIPHPAQLPELCSILVEARVAVTPMGTGLRFAGTMEIGPNDLGINEARVRGIQKAAHQYFPEIRKGDLEGLPVWSGLRPCSPDGVPLLGRTQKWKNVSIGTGHAMMGLSLGPVSGKLIVDGLTKGMPSRFEAALNPDRF